MSTNLLEQISLSWSTGTTYKQYDMKMREIRAKNYECYTELSANFSEVGHD